MTDRAYRSIKREILSNRITAGSPLPVDRMMRDLGLSRTPVREAILRLEREGLVEIRPRLGTFVAPLEIGRIREMYQVRGALEATAARAVASRSDSLSSRFSEIAARLRALPLGDLPAMSEAGHDLHRCIVEDSGNRVLLEIIDGLHDHFERFRHFSLRLPQKVESSHREHLRMVDAIERGSVDDAERLVREHFENAARHLLESLVSQLGSPASTPIGLSLSLNV